MPFLRTSLCIISFYLWSLPAHAQDLYVSKAGHDSNSGSKDEPFLTINHAVSRAKAGDSVIIREGTYREQVNLARGGESESKRLVISAAEGEKVFIKGSERVKNWQWDDKKKYWTVSVDKDVFGSFNPFKASVRYPKRVTVDSEFNQTGWQTYGLNVHRGNVLINNAPLKEVFNTSTVSKTNMSWFVEVKKNQTLIYANFNALNPNEEMTEILVREKVIAATKRMNVSYVTVKGLRIHHAATYWAPPTVYQPGMIEPNGGNHWIIENNDISHSRAVCISIGIPKGEVRIRKEMAIILFVIIEYTVVGKQE